MSEPTAADVQRMITDAQNEIAAALGRLTAQLPPGFVVTGCEVGAINASTVGGERNYILTAEITVQVWTGDKWGRA